MKNKLKKRSLLMIIILSFLLTAQISYSYKNVFKLKFEGLALGMSVSEAIKSLNSSGYIETKNTENIDERQYNILQTQKNGIP